jgi:hypothetical protein
VDNCKTDPWEGQGAVDDEPFSGKGGCSAASAEGWSKRHGVDCSAHRRTEE